MEGILNSWAWGWEHTSPLRSFLEPFGRGHSEDPPKDDHVLIAGTYDSYSTCKRNLAVKGHEMGIIQWAQHHHMRL